MLFEKLADFEKSRGYLFSFDTPRVLTATAAVKYFPVEVSREILSSSV
jgi:hypothetical protein